LSPKNVNALSWAKKAIGLHGCEKATLVKIADNIRDIVNDECYKAIPNIAKEHGISARTLEYGLTGRTDPKTGKRVVQGLESRGILTAVGGRKGGGFRYDENGKRCGITTHWKINIPVLITYLSEKNADALRKKLGWDVTEAPEDENEAFDTELVDESANQSANEFANQSAKVGASVRKSGGDESAKVRKSVRNIADNLLSTSSPEKSNPDTSYVLTRDSIAEPPRCGNNSKANSSGNGVNEVNAAVFAACGQTAKKAEIVGLLETHTAKEIIEAFQKYTEAQHDDRDVRWAVKNFFRDGGGEAVILACAQKKAADDLQERGLKASLEAGRAVRKAEEQKLLDKRREEDEADARMGENPF
jgi:hypothetical protein